MTSGGTLARVRSSNSSASLASFEPSSRKSCALFKIRFRISTLRNLMDRKRLADS